MSGIAGELRLFAGSYAPRDWLLCDGSLRNIADDHELFDAIGAKYGGDGKTTFALPNLRTQLPVHPAGGVALGSVGQTGSGLPPHFGLLLPIIARIAPFHDPFLGEVRTFAFDVSVKDWEPCEGQLLPLNSFTTFFTVLENRFGGDYPRTFALPDLRKTVIGKDGLRCVGASYRIALQGVYPPRGD